MTARELPNRMDVPGDHKHAVGGDPILRSWHGREGTRSVQVYACGGLHYIRGNTAPHFSLTIAKYVVIGNRRHEDSFGAAHDELLARWPELAPLAALHLSTWDGVPMHAEANGFYDLAGYAGGLGQRHHAGNADTYGRHGEETPEQVRERCLRLWADHVRIPIDAARTLADAIIVAAREEAAATGWQPTPGVIHEQAAIGQAARRHHAAFIEAQKPRWQREADACVAALGIAYYYGDRMPEAAGVAEG